MTRRAHDHLWMAVNAVVIANRRAAEVGDVDALRYAVRLIEDAIVSLESVEGRMGSDEANLSIQRDITSLKARAHALRERINAAA